MIFPRSAEKYFLFNSLYVLIVRILTNNQNNGANCLSLYLNANAVIWRFYSAPHGTC